MATKQFKAESKRLLDLMINSIYTHKEIFLRELISNASDATDKLYYNAMKEGKTGITRDSLPIELTLDKANRRFIIEDHGCGMTSEVQARIFEKFYQADTSHATKGNCLGLSLVKKIVELCEGDIYVSSEVGKGTTFTIELRDRK